MMNHNLAETQRRQQIQIKRCCIKHYQILKVTRKEGDQGKLTQTIKNQVRQKLMRAFSQLGKEAGQES